MKFIIELEDDKLLRTIEAQVSRAIAEMTTEVIKAKIDQILEIKFGRVDDKVVDAAVTKAAREHVVSAYPTDQYSSGKIKAVMSDAAISLLKQVR